MTAVAAVLACTSCLSPMKAQQTALHRIPRAARAVSRRRIDPHAAAASGTRPQGTQQPRQQADAAAAPWTPIGPQQVLTRAYGLVTGRVTSIAVDPHDATGNTVYVGTTGGGVWKSTNAAAAPGSVSFSPLTDAIPAYTTVSTLSLSVGALTVQPGGTGVVLAGTGDPNDALDSYYGGGILRSDNGGNTWYLISSTSDAFNGGYRNSSFLGLAFSGFAWSTTSPGTVVAAVSDAIEGAVVNAPVDGYSTTGLYYSTDSGQTWYMATIEDANGQIIQSPDYELFSGGNPATSVVWNPVRKRFYAAVRFHGYYDSPDGITWTRLANQPGPTLTQQLCPTNPRLPASTSCPIYRGSIAVQPVTGDLFAWTVDLNNQDQGLYRDVCTAVGGVCSSPTVRFQQKIESVALEAGNGDSTIPQGDYNLTLAAVPSQQDTLLFAGTGDVYRASMANSFTWRNTTNVNTCAAAYVAPSNHAIDGTFSPIGLIYFGNDGGLWRTTDDVNQTQPACSSDDAAHYQNLNANLGSLAEVSSFSGDPTDAGTLLVALGALGTASSASGQPAWTQVLGGEGAHTAVDPASSQNWYASSGPGVAINLCVDGAACTAQNFSTPLIQSAQVGSDGDQLLLPATWMLDPQNSANVIVGTCRVWRGPGAGGASLDPLSPMLDGDQQPYCNGNAQIRSLAASGTPSDTPGVPELVYAGMAGALDGGAPFNGAGGGAPGHIYVAPLTGQMHLPVNWSDLYRHPVTNLAGGAGLFNPGGFDISSIAVDPHDPTGQTVYVTVEGFDNNGRGGPAIYRSIDGGAHWLSINGGDLPNAPANSVVVDPNDAGTVYVALDTGVYVTRNVSSCSDPTLNCWTPFGTSLPKSPVTALRVFQQGNTSLLQAATYGRGLWQIPLLAAGQQQSTAAFSGAQTLTFSGQPLQSSSLQQTLTLSNTGQVPLSISQITVSGDFAEQDNCTGSAIPPGGSCAIQVTFTPSALGSRTGTLTVFANIPGGQLTASLTGTGAAAPAIVLTPSALNFGSVLNGVTSPVQYMTISNTGGATVTLQTPKITGDFALSANTCGASLQPNYGCTVGITFTPSVSGARSGVLSVTDGAGTQTAQLSGTGLSPATDTLSTQALVFGPVTVGAVGAPQSVTITNSGGTALTEIAVRTTGDFSEVNNCGPILSAGLTCAVTVSYIPRSIGAAVGTLTITDILHQQTIALSGIGVAPLGVVSASPQQVSFGSQGVGFVSVPQVVTLVNNGAVPLASLAYAVSGSFSLQRAANACGSSLAVGATCSIGLVFDPAQTGPQTGTLTVNGGNLPTPLTAQLSGAGADFNLNSLGNPTIVITSGQTASWQFRLSPQPGSSGTVNFTCSGAPANTLCTVNPTSLTLQSGVTGTVTMTVTTAAVAAAPEPAGPLSAPWSRARTALTLACLLPLGLLPRRRLGLIAVAAAVLTLLPTACGVSSSGGSSVPPPGSAAGSTTSGTYTLTLSGALPGIRRDAAVTLIVQ